MIFFNFFSKFHPKCFGHIWFLYQIWSSFFYCYFLYIIFLIKFIFLISSLIILFHFIFMFGLYSLNFFLCCFGSFFKIIFFWWFYHSIFDWLRIEFLNFFGVVILISFFGHVYEMLTWIDKNIFFNLFYTNLFF
jgi:hypothetical protein